MSATDDIERQIEGSRERLAATLAELRLATTPKQIGGELFEITRNAGTLKKVALPALLLGAGVALTLLSNRKRSGRALPDDPLHRLDNTPRENPPQNNMSNWVMAACLAFLASAAATKQLNGVVPPLNATASPGPELTLYKEDEIEALPQPAQETSFSGPAVCGWKAVLLGLYNNVSAHRILAIAAGVTFYSLLAIFPALAALVSLYGLFSDAGTIAGHLDDLSGVMPGGALDILREQLMRVTAQGQGALGLTFGLSLVTSIWSANAGMKAFFDALNVIYGETEKRGFIKLNALSLLFTGGAILFLLVALAAVVVLPALLNFVGFAGAIDPFLPLLRWPAMFIVVTLAVALLYRFGPSHDQPKWRWISWGSAIAALVWLATSILFSWYTAHFSSYNATYGSLGAVVGFMVWIWLSTVVFLMGAQLDAQLEDQTQTDAVGGRTAVFFKRGTDMTKPLGTASMR